MCDELTAFIVGWIWIHVVGPSIFR